MGLGNEMKKCDLFAIRNFQTPFFQILTWTFNSRFAIRNSVNRDNWAVLSVPRPAVYRPRVHGRRSIGRPAELFQGGPETGEGHTHYIEIAAFDAGYVATTEALDSVGAGFVEGLAGSDVGVDFGVGELGELHAGDFFDYALDFLGHADYGETSVNFVHGAA